MPTLFELGWQSSKESPEKDGATLMPVVQAIARYRLRHGWASTKVFPVTLAIEARPEAIVVHELESPAVQSCSMPWM